MNTTLLVSIKSHYGNEHIYPACDMSRRFAAMLGRKTLTRSDIAHIKGLGFTISLAPSTVSL